jgi:hypothetical protein
VRARGDELWRISDLHPAYDPLHFVLFHPHGEPGWQPYMPHAAVAPINPPQPPQDDDSEEVDDVEHVATDAGPAQPAQRKKITAREWACYHMHDRNPTSHALFVYGKRLYQEWCV